MPRDPLSDTNHPMWEDTSELAALREQGYFNISRHEPWYRAWLTSWQLFATCRDFAPRYGNPIHTVLGGTVYECGRGSGTWAQVWIAPGELVAAYPSLSERYPEAGQQYGGLHEFAEWIEHLRKSPPLELGLVRDRSSYGARWAGGPAEPPDVKWAQWGDLVALSRNWWFASIGVG